MVTARSGWRGWRERHGIVQDGDKQLRARRSPACPWGSHSRWLGSHALPSPCRAAAASARAPLIRCSGNEADTALTGCSACRRSPTCTLVMSFVGSASSWHAGAVTRYYVSECKVMPFIS